MQWNDISTNKTPPFPKRYLIDFIFITINMFSNIITWKEMFLGFQAFVYFWGPQFPFFWFLSR